MKHTEPDFGDKDSLEEGGLLEGTTGALWAESTLRWWCSQWWWEQRLHLRTGSTRSG